MSQLTLYDMQGKEVGKVSLVKEKWEIEPHVPSMHAALVRQLANGRAGTADTKTRGEVSGGGKKPWKQKGTGRARHGSTRSPIWKKGGVVFGPHPRDYTISLPRRVRRLALQSALADKLSEKRLTVVDSLALDAPKTRQMEEILSALELDDKTLVVLHEKNENVAKSARNIPGVKVILAQNLNVHDLLTYEAVLLTRDSLALVEEVFLR